MKNKRLFIGISLSENISTELSNTLKKLQISAKEKDYNIKWVPNKNLHITLKFLGDTPESEFSEICAKLKTFSQTIHPLKLEVKNISAFPEITHARVIWAGVQHKQELFDLQNQLDHLFPQKAEEDFTPHITLARLRSAKSVSNFISPFVRKKFGTMVLDRITLFESVLQGNFTIYQTVEVFSLQA